MPRLAPRLCLLTLLALLLAATRGAAETPDRRLRRPIDLVFASGGRHLLVANRRSGSISLVDVTSRQVVAEVVVGKTLSAVTRVPGSQLVLATDEAAHELIGLVSGGRSLVVAWRVPLATSPVAVSVDPERRRAVVASLWSRRLTTLVLDGLKQPRVAGVIDLPFAPRRLLWLPDGRLVVAEAFGGRVGLVDPRRGRLLAVRTLEAHNIGRMTLAPGGRDLLVPQQLLDAHHATTRGGVHWGGVLLNVVRTVSLAQLDADAEDLRGRRGLDYLGVPDRAAGDPVAMAVAAGGRRVVLLAGVHEIATSLTGIGYYARTRLGLGPTALVLDPTATTAWVANRFSDSVSLVRLDPLEQLAEIPLGPPPLLSAVDRGEQLFRDARLSSDGWFSCHSCHTRGHTNTRLNDNFGDDTYGAPKKVLSLLGTADTGPWAWNGEMPRLLEQVDKSVRLTMRGPELATGQTADLAAYLSRLSPPPSLARARGLAEGPAVGRGRLVFARVGCKSCHAPPTYTSPKTYDVGLPDELGRRWFNPPSLRGVGQRGRLFHDNRAADLDEVIGRFRHGLEQPLEDAERRSLVKFLESL